MFKILCENKNTQNLVLAPFWLNSKILKYSDYKKLEKKYQATIIDDFVYVNPKIFELNFQPLRNVFETDSTVQTIIKLLDRLEIDHVFFKLKGPTKLFVDLNKILEHRQVIEEYFSKNQSRTTKLRRTLKRKKEISKILPIEGKSLTDLARSQKEIEQIKKLAVYS